MWRFGRGQEADHQAREIPHGEQEIPLAISQGNMATKRVFLNFSNLLLSLNKIHTYYYCYFQLNCYISHFQDTECFKNFQNLIFLVNILKFTFFFSFLSAQYNIYVITQYNIYVIIFISMLSLFAKSSDRGVVGSHNLTNCALVI